MLTTNDPMTMLIDDGQDPTRHSRAAAFLTMESHLVLPWFQRRRRLVLAQGILNTVKTLMSCQRIGTALAVRDGNSQTNSSRASQ